MNAEIAISTPIPTANTTAMTRLNRVKPVAEGTCALSGQKFGSAGPTITASDSQATMASFCDAFAAGNAPQPSPEWGFGGANQTALNALTEGSLMETRSDRVGRFGLG